MIARNSHNRSQAVILQQNPIKIFSENRLQKVYQHLHHFRFDGTYLQLEVQLEGMNGQAISGFTHSSIRVSGVQLQSFDRCCCVCTYLSAGLLLFPIFLVLTDWWKRHTYPAYDIDKTIYQKLSVLLTSPKLEHMKLTVNDCSFNLQKANILLKLVKQSLLKSFTFQNQAQQFDFEDDSYSKFEQNMKPFKEIPNLTTELRWGSKIVIK